MKGASNVIMFIIAVIIAASILLLSFDILGLAKGGIEDITGTGQTYQQRLAGVQSLSQVCNDWMGGEKFNAESILKVYKLPDKIRPYRDLWNGCGEDLESLANECFNEREATRDCAGNGFIRADADEMLSCTNACSNVNRIFEKCDASCPDYAALCFENLLEDFSASELTKTVTITNNALEYACSGR